MLDSYNAKYFSNEINRACLVEIDFLDELEGGGEGGKERGARVTNLFLCGSESSVETELGRNTFNAVGGVDVLDAGDLEARGGALTGDDGRVCEEVFPNLSQGGYFFVCLVGLRGRG